MRNLFFKKARALHLELAKHERSTLHQKGQHKCMSAPHRWGRKGPSSPGGRGRERRGKGNIPKSHDPRLDFPKIQMTLRNVKIKKKEMLGRALQ